MSRTRGLCCPSEREVKFNGGGRGWGQHTSVRDALNSSINEGGSGSVRVQINDIHSVPLRGMRVHQHASIDNNTSLTVRGIPNAWLTEHRLD
jgi:hypothetical protein